KALIQEQTLECFDEAVKGLLDMSQREGEALKQFLMQRISSISQQVAQVRTLLPQLMQAQRQHLKNKLADLEVNVEPERLEQEMVIVLQKADVDEELDRLEAHVKEVAHIMEQAGPVGRRLDFMMQELNREANTLSSKSISSQTTNIAVELKVLIEQMREQVQNIE
ncbi:MAG: YicC family protein, partial [Cytophagales bacterium]|nr:YicC family protein [Cytophagales bacterium]